MLQSPLFVSTDTESDSEGDEFDSDNYDNDNDSIDSEDISPVEARTPKSIQQEPRFQISNGNETISFVADEMKESHSPSCDPFAVNYRKKADWDPVAKTRWEREWSFVPNVVEKYESVEHAEFTRPFDQFRVLLQERGLYAKYEERWSSAPDPVTRSCDVMNMLLEEAPDLIVRYATLEKLTAERVAAMERGEKACWEVAWEKRKRAEGPWKTPKIE